MSEPVLVAADAAAIVVLTFGLYFPRHRRKDLAVAYLGVNVGVLAVASALSSSDVSAGLGLGLFGVLSIIRLRSAELDQEEIAYYFASLALGVLGGFPVSPDWLSPALMAGIVLTLLVADHPGLFARYRVQEIVLDTAYTDEAELVRRLETMLGATVRRVTVRKVDLVNDTTRADVRFELPDPGLGRVS